MSQKVTTEIEHITKFVSTGKPREDYKLEAGKAPYISGSAEFYINGDRCASSLDNGDLSLKTGYKLFVIEFGTAGFIFSFLHIKDGDTPKLGTEITVKYRVRVKEHV